MKSDYPSIGGPDARHLGSPCVAFHKYDGSNLRFLWQEAQGWFRFGTRSQWLKKRTPIFGGALDLFEATVAPGLLAVVKQRYSHVRNLVAFCEFFGPSSFAGMHEAAEPKQLRLFDVWMPNRGFIPPKEFVESFSQLPIAEAVYEGPFDRDFIEAVKAGKYPVREGVVAKGTVSRGDRLEVWSAKVKTKAWLDELARRAAVSEGLRRQLNDNLSEQGIPSEVK